MFTDRELATILAALRHWQDERLMDDVTEPEGHFTEHTPLTIDEIDDLCEKLNTRSLQTRTISISFGRQRNGRNA